ncbi:hypothetical protein HanXRQr2_Chr11g0484811 [Helianthus annuus]|nr:hypothetical protein HanXRQr2_Chr11g0484811 [Helianthus annuus]KAJ0874639.1 hypothetical protein HanPSC8_Chr11g0466611 [Helianthus annuus]
MKTSKPNPRHTLVDKMKSKLVAVLCCILLILTVLATVTQGSAWRAFRFPQDLQRILEVEPPTDLGADPPSYLLTLIAHPPSNGFAEYEYVESPLPNN